MKIDHLAIAIVATISLCGCNRQHTTHQTTDEKAVPLEINVGVAHTTTPMQTSPSKAGIIGGTTFGHEQKINAILVDENPISATPEYPAESKFVCTLSTDNGTTTTTWNPIDPQKPLKVMMNPARVLVHYPAELPQGSTLSANKRILNAELTEILTYGSANDLKFTTVEIKVPPTSEEKEVYFAWGDEDYMVGKSAKIVTSLPDPQTQLSQAIATIEMKHALAMIVVQLQIDEGNPETASAISALSIENTNATTGPMTRGAIDMQTNTFTPNTIRTNYSRTLIDFPITAKFYFGMMIYPTTLSADGDVQIKCSVGAVNYSYKVPAIEWKAGLVYLYTLKLTAASGVLGDAVKVVEWPTTTTTHIELE